MYFMRFEFTTVYLLGMWRHDLLFLDSPFTSYTVHMYSRFHPILSFFWRPSVIYRNIAVLSYTTDIISEQ